MKLPIKSKEPIFLNIPVPIMFSLYMFLTISRFYSVNTLAILVIMGVIIYRGLTYSKNIRFNKILLSFIILILYNLILMCLYPSYKGVYYFLVELLSFSFIIPFTVGLIDDEYLNKLSKLLSIFYLSFSLLFIFAYFNGKVNMIHDSFALGIYQALYGISFFVLYKSKRMFSCTIWLALLPFLSGERGLAIATIIVLLIYYIIPLISKNKFFYKCFFWIIAIACTSFQFIYVWLATVPIGTTINRLSSQYTNQNFFSGRQIIWGVVNNYIIDSPIIGYGLGNEILSSNSIFMSAHNTYVDILLSGGIIGLLLFFYFIYTIWESMYLYLNDKIIRLSMSFLISSLVFGVNGVIFVGNDISFTLFILLIFGIGIMRKNYLNNMKDEGGILNV